MRETVRDWRVGEGGETVRETDEWVTERETVRGNG